MGETEEEGLPMRRRFPTSILIACGAIGPLLFMFILLIEGATRPGYSAWHDSVSSLSLSTQGWVQIGNFLLCGLLVLGFALGLRRVLQEDKGAVLGPSLLGVLGLALIGAGIFPVDPNLGYPPGAASSWPGMQTLHSHLNSLAGAVAYLSLTATSLVMARRFAHDPAWRGWAVYSIVTGILVVGFIVISTLVALLVERADSPVGLLQRIALLAGFSWIALVALRLLGTKTRSTSPRRDTAGADKASRASPDSR
jgi:hypothetical protein